MKRYYEIRHKPSQTIDQLVADMMRHLHARQYLGRALIICQEPAKTRALAHKQWLKLARVLQERRAATWQADAILRYTRDITHMQNLVLTAQPLSEQPQAEVVFAAPTEPGLVAFYSATLYVTTTTPISQLQRFSASLPQAGLIVDYTQAHDWPGQDLAPKQELETQVRSAWQGIERYLQSRGIEFDQLLAEPPRDDPGAFDDAIDALLERNTEFLTVAEEFQQLLELAQPLYGSGKRERERYSVFAVLTHRVRALTPGYSSRPFLRLPNGESFLLREPLALPAPVALRGLEQAVARHQQAGRWRLAQAMLGLALAS